MRDLRFGKTRPAVLTLIVIGLLAAILVRDAKAQCRGDCGNDGAVSVDEIVTLVNIALGNVEIDSCEAGDLNGDGQITVEEILAAVADALGGCAMVVSEWVQVDPTTGLQDIWGASLTDIFAVGGEGRVRHFDGQSWTGMDSGTTFNLLAVWGFAGDDVYAVGFNNQTIQKGIILHYDGDRWTEVAHGQTDTYFRDVWGTATNDVFVVGGIEGFGTPGVILHYGPGGWTQQLLVNDSQPHNQLRGVWGFASDDVYAVGSGQAAFETNPGMPALAFHYNGDVWQRMPTMSGVFNSVWGPAAGDVYASGGPTGVAHFNGQQWSALPSDDLFSPGTFFPIWGFGPQDIFFGLIHYDGVEFVNTRDPESLLFDVNGLWGPPDGSVIYGASRDGVWKLER
jgi:hypothetical protein